MGVLDITGDNFDDLDTFLQPFLSSIVRFFYGQLTPYARAELQHLGDGQNEGATASEENSEGVGGRHIPSGDGHHGGGRGGI